MKASLRAMPPKYVAREAIDMNFADLCDWYFTHYAPNNLKESTQYNYKYIADRILLPNLGELPLEAFQNRMLTEWFAGLDVTPSYCRTIFVVMRSIFSVALQNGFVDYHPCDYVILPKKPPIAEERVPRLTEEQARELFRMTEQFSWFHSIIRFLLLTGVRSGEAFGLRWQDIDFERKIIHIRYNLMNVASRHWLDTPKTKNSIRQIAMSPSVEKLLERQKMEQAVWKTEQGACNFLHPEMVFTTVHGNYADHNYVERKFKTFIAGTSFEDITLHSLRHANATLMLAAGVDLKVVSTLLGHSSIATTANLYTDVLERTKLEAARCVAEKLDLTG